MTVTQENIRLVPASSDNIDVILSIYQRSPTYFHRVSGSSPTLETVQRDMVDQPKKQTASYRKEFLVLYRGPEPFGVADIHYHHPDVGIAYLGLLLIDETRWGQGLGRKAYLEIEGHIRAVSTIQLIRLGISNQNDVSGFWRKVGFKENGRTYPWRDQNRDSLVIEFEKPL